MCEVSDRVFCAIQNLDIMGLSTYPEDEIRAVLPSLVRMSLLSPLDNTQSSMESRKLILTLLIGIEVVNSIVSYLQVNYHELEIELKKELQVRQKSLYSDYQSVEFGLQTGIALGFERADVTRKVRVVLSEIFNIQWQLSELKMENKSFIQSEIFDDGIYLEEVIDILCISLAELPSLLNILDLTDILLSVPNGQRIICCLVANFPDCYKDVVTHVILNCDEESTDGKHKLSLLMALSDMNPSQALNTRAICLEILKVPSLMLKLSLKYPQDLIAFISGMLLGNDQVIRSWFAVFIRTSQKRKGDVLNLVREELLHQLQTLIKMSKSTDYKDDYTVQGVVMLRLYCALRGIAGLKFNDEEINLLSQLAISRPLPTQSGLRFVSLALCTLIACPSLLSTTVLENKSVEWLQWLIKEDAFFGKKSDTTTSLDEMLLLLAIHFHSNQISAIGELVCSTLAMKIPIRPNSTNKIKQVFTQDLFTEQVVASHAVRVPVTVNLNANMPGYLPVHCIHQLLKSRAFLKHKVPIKYWIYKQICNSVRPLHPVMPALIEVYVNTLIIPNTLGKTNIDHLNCPFTENEIVHIFEASHSIPTLSELMYKSEDNEHINTEVKCNITSQLLILYYLVLYEDIRLTNIVNIATGGRKLKEYCNSFLSELPMKYLLQEAQQYHDSYVGLFHPLLRLIISNYPHLSMVEDWLEENHNFTTVRLTRNSQPKINQQIILNTIKNVHINSAKTIQVLKTLLKLPPEELCQYSNLIVINMSNIFKQGIPRIIQELYKNIWIRLNSVLPISFWKITINAITGCDDLMNNYTYSNENLADPLYVLRCSKSTLHSPYVLMIVLRILQGTLAASKAYLNIKIQSKQIFDKNIQVQFETDREDLKTALNASQDSAAVHILLEVLADFDKNHTKLGSALALRETQGIICSFIHQSFISEPSLAKLVHFQTYPREVIPMIVMGVPSMHICIDFLHEFLSMPEIDKQVFTIELASHLALKYSIPKSLSTSKFCINTIGTTLTLLSTDLKCKFLADILPALVRFAEAFPVLIDDCINILMMIGRCLYSQETLGFNALQTHLISTTKCRCRDTKKYISLIEEAFHQLVTQLLSKTDLY